LAEHNLSANDLPEILAATPAETTAHAPVNDSDGGEAPQQATDDAMTNTGKRRGWRFRSVGNSKIEVSHARRNDRPMRHTLSGIPSFRMSHRTH
jgi:hypothetical protein